MTFTYKILSDTVYSNISESSSIPHRKQKTINYKHITESLLRNDFFHTVPITLFNSYILHDLFMNTF